MTTIQNFLTLQSLAQPFCMGSSIVDSVTAFLVRKVTNVALTQSKIFNADWFRKNWNEETWGVSYQFLPWAWTALATGIALSLYSSVPFMVGAGVCEMHSAVALFFLQEESSEEQNKLYFLTYLVVSVVLTLLMKNPILANACSHGMARFVQKEQVSYWGSCF